jgi:hypothetical protein
LIVYRDGRVPMTPPGLQWPPERSRSQAIRTGTNRAGCRTTPPVEAALGAAQDVRVPGAGGCG